MHEFWNKLNTREKTVLELSSEAFSITSRREAIDECFAKKWAIYFEDDAFYKRSDCRNLIETNAVDRADLSGGFISIRDYLILVGKDMVISSALDQSFDLILCFDFILSKKQLERVSELMAPSGKLWAIFPVVEMQGRYEPRALLNEEIRPDLSTFEESLAADLFVFDFPDCKRLNCFLSSSSDEGIRSWLLVEVEHVKDQAVQIPEECSLGCEPKTLISWVDYEHFVFSQNQIWCGPRVEDRIESGRVKSLRYTGEYSVSDILERIPAEDYPDVFLAGVDAYMQNVPRGITAFTGPKILFIGDTHHGSRPITRMLNYVSQEKYDFVVSLYTPQHLHFFASLMELNQLYWFPNFNLSTSVGFADSPRRVNACFAGRLSEHHPYRIKTVQALMTSKVPFLFASKDVDYDWVHRENLLGVNLSLNGDYNLRSSGLMGAGAFMLSDPVSRYSGLHRFFKEEEHYSVFHSPEELIQKVNQLLENPSKTQEKAAKTSAIYWENLSPEKLRQNLVDLMEGGEILDAFSVSADPRSLYTRAKSVNELLDRVSVYEMVQELHQFNDFVHVCVTSEVECPYLTDLSDLPRVALRREFVSDDKLKADSSLLELCNLSDLCCSDLNTILSTEGFCVLLCTVNDLQRIAQGSVSLANVSVIFCLGSEPFQAGSLSYLQNTGYSLTSEFDRLRVFQLVR